MIETPFLWRKSIYEICDRYMNIFEEYGLDDELRRLLNSLDYLLTILSTKLPYQFKSTKVRDFLEELDRFRAYISRYVGRVAEELYRNVMEIIDDVFNVEVVEDV